MKKITVVLCWICIGLSGYPLNAQENKLVIWSHWGHEPVKVKFMEAVSREFEKTAGIPGEIEWIPKMDLIDKLVFALDTPEPDITYVDTGFTHPRILRALFELSDLPTTGRRDPSWRLGQVGDAPNVFLPIEGLSNAIYYHKALFAKAGIVLPHNRRLTSAEFLDIIRTLRNAGMTPIGEGSKNRTLKIGLPLLNTIFRFAGPEKITRLLNGEITFFDPDVRAALTFWKQIVDIPGYDREKALELTLDEGIYEVTDGRAAISFCGTYLYAKYGSTDRDHGQIGVLDWFTVENGKGNAYYEMTWPAGFGINRNSQRLNDAKAFLAYLLTPAAASLWAKYVQSPYPVMTDDGAAESLYGMLADQRRGQQLSPYPFSYPGFASEAARNMWEEEVRDFITGKHSVEQVIGRMNSRLE